MKACPERPSRVSHFIDPADVPGHGRTEVSHLIDEAGSHQPGQQAAKDEQFLRIVELVAGDQITPGNQAAQIVEETNARHHAQGQTQGPAPILLETLPGLRVAGLVPQPLPIVGVHPLVPVPVQVIPGFSGHILDGPFGVFGKFLGLINDPLARISNAKQQVQGTGLAHLHGQPAGPRPEEPVALLAGIGVAVGPVLPRDHAGRASIVANAAAVER